MKILTAVGVLTASLTSIVGAATVAEAAPPPNDDFSHATVVSTFPFSTLFDTTEASRAPDDPGCGTDASVWFSYKAKKTGAILASASGSYLTSIGAYTATRTSLTEVACNNAGFGDAAAVQLRVRAGQTYHFLISAALEGDRGTATFTVQNAPTMAVKMSPLGTVDADGIVTLRGTYSCSQFGVIFFDLQAQQGSARDPLAENTFSCPASKQSFEVFALSSTEAPFKPGRVGVAYNAAFRGHVGGFVASDEVRTVRLRRPGAPAAR